MQFGHTHGRVLQEESLSYKSYIALPPEYQGLIPISPRADFPLPMFQNVELELDLAARFTDTL